VFLRWLLCASGNPDDQDRPGLFWLAIEKVRALAFAVLKTKNILAAKGN
jgi:hypothetical protein